jgi:hypothetical protein
VFAVLDAVFAEEVGLDGDKGEHDRDTDAKVEVGETGTDVAEAVVVDEDGKDAVKVEEEQARQTSVGVREAEDRATDPYAKPL